MKKQIFKALFLFAGILGLTLLLLVVTPLGLPAAIKIVGAFVPGELTVKGYSGRLIDNIHVDSLTYQNDRMNLTLEDVTLKWRALALVTRTLDIEYIEAKNLLIRPLSGFEEDAGFPLDLSPFVSDSVDVLIEKFQIHAHGADLSGSMVLNKKGLRLRQINLKHPLIEAQLQANIGPGFNPPIKIIVDESFQLDHFPVMTAQARLLGNLDKLEGSLNFTEGLDAALHVQVQHLGPSFTFVASGQTHFADLSLLDPKLSGQIHGELQVQYENTSGNGKVSVQTQDSEINGQPLRIDFSGQIESYILKWKNALMSLGQDKLTSSGLVGPEALDVNWNLSLSRLDTLVHSTGVFQKAQADSVLATLKTLSIRFPDKRVYALNHPAIFRFSQKGLALTADACLKGPDASQVCAHQETDTSLAFTFNRIPYDLLGKVTSLPLKISGQVDGKAVLTLEGFQVQQLEGSADLSSLELLRGKRKTRSVFKTGRGKLDFTLTPTLFKTQGHLALIEADQLDWTLEISDWSDPKLANLKGDFQGAITHWDPLRLWITDTNDFSGQVNLNVQVTGPVNQPLYGGSLTLENARLALPASGLILQDGKLTLTPSTNHHDLKIEGSIRSGDGVLNASGDLSFDSAWPRLRLHLTGENFLFANTSTAVAKASPRLQLTTDGNKLDITGELHIPEAKLNFKGYQSYISPSPDIVIVNERGQTRPFLYDIHTRITLSLGDQITLQASQLNTGVQGKILLVKQPDTPVRATGQLVGVNGKYAAYGKKLNLSKAIVTFNNTPIDNPSLFIEASRTVQVSQLNTTQYMFTDPTPQTPQAMLDATVGLRITGTVQNPKYQFFSSIPMSEADQLSYLLTGAPSSQIGAAQAAFMFAALTETSGMLGISDTDAARLQNITRTLGIDFNIESGSHIDSTTGERVNDTNLVVGKAIRPRLYISYTVGLLDPLNVFRVRYQLSRHWAAQSQANSQGDTGGDILYGIESDAFLGMD